MMKTVELVAAAALALVTGAGSAAATLTISASDNGTPITLNFTSPSAGILNATGNDAAFNVGVSASGTPAIPDPALGTTTLNVSHTGGATDTLLITVDQTGLSGVANFTSNTDMTVNGLIGAPGPSVLSMLVGGVVLDTFTFPATGSTATQNFIDTNPGPIFEDSQTYSIQMTGNQAALDTISFVAAAAPVNEPGSLAVLAGALFGLGWMRRRTLRG